MFLNNISAAQAANSNTVATPFSPAEARGPTTNHVCVSCHEDSKPVLDRQEQRRIHTRRAEPRQGKASFQEGRGKHQRRHQQRGKRQRQRRRCLEFHHCQDRQQWVAALHQIRHSGSALKTLTHNLGRIVCLEHSGSQRTTPKPPKTSRYRRLEPKWLLVVVVVLLCVVVCCCVLLCVCVCCVCVCCCVLLCVVVCCCVLLCVVVCCCVLLLCCCGCCCVLLCVLVCCCVLLCVVVCCCVLLCVVVCCCVLLWLLLLLWLWLLVVVVVVCWLLWWLFVGCCGGCCCCCCFRHVLTK